MVRCPVCGSTQIVIAIGGPGRAVCSHCRSEWHQRGADQSSIRSPIHLPRTAPPLR